MLPDGARDAPFCEHFADGRAPAAINRALAVEVPIAIEINGLGYAVMMATPADLEDYALGFCLSEQLIASATEFKSADGSEVADGAWILRVQLSALSAAPLMERARLRLAEGSCGLCGIESLEQVMRPLTSVASQLVVEDVAVFRAVAALSSQQVLGAVTRAAHAAAFCDPSGAILAVREDVGRHNALDKLLGALARQGLSPRDGFILLTARCSFELVQKTIIAGCPMLVTVSAASTLAAAQARKHGLRLCSLARDDSFLES